MSKYSFKNVKRLIGVLSKDTRKQFTGGEYFEKETRRIHLSYPT